MRLIAHELLLATVPPMRYSRDAQVRLARAVAARDEARLLDEENRSDSRASVTEAVESGRAYFVRPRAGLFVIDMDLPADADSARARTEAFETLKRAAGSCGVPSVTASSGRPGNAHLYLLLGEAGAARTNLEQWCRARGLDVRDAGIRPPGAPHRSSEYDAARLIEPGDPAVAIGILSGTGDVAAAERLSERLTGTRLPRRVWTALQRGHEAAGYESASHGRMALAVALRARDATPGLLRWYLTQERLPLGGTFRGRPIAWQQQELDRLWEKATSWLGRRPAHSPIVMRIDRFAAALRKSHWKGMAGGTDLAVAEAFLKRARDAWTTAVGLALADVAVMAGVSRDTARCSVRRLLEAGWLETISEETPRTSRVYGLTVPRTIGVTEAEIAEAVAARKGTGWFSDLGADVARWRGLGKLTVLVGRVVGEAAATVGQLSERLGIRPAAVRHHLRKLERFGLVVEECGMWHVGTGEVDTAVLEEALGVAGCRERQRLAVAQERAARRAHLVDPLRLRTLVAPRAPMRA